MHVTYLITRGEKCEVCITSVRVLVIKMWCLCNEGYTSCVIHSGMCYYLEQQLKGGSESRFLFTSGFSKNSFSLLFTFPLYNGNDFSVHLCGERGWLVVVVIQVYEYLNIIKIVQQNQQQAHPLSDSSNYFRFCQYNLKPIWAFHISE